DSLHFMPDEPVKLDFITISPDKEPVGNQFVAISVKHIRQEHIQEEFDFWYELPEYTTSYMGAYLITDAAGKTQLEFLPDKPGIYEVTARTTDDMGRVHTSVRRVYSGITRRNLYRHMSDFDMIPDKDAPYEVGQTARLMIPTPLRGALLLTVERDNVITTEILYPTEGVTVYDLEIREDFAPNVFVRATLMGRDEQGHPAYVRSRAELSVRSSQNILNVDFIPPAEQPHPGETTQVGVRVTDIDGEPIRAEVGLALIDEAVLDLMTTNTLPIADVFHGAQLHRVRNDYSLDGLVDDRNNAMDLHENWHYDTVFSGMRGVMSDFDSYNTTPLWSPDLITDENGYVQVDVRLPYHTTRWRLIAYAVTVDTKVGQAETTIIPINTQHP
ncbi:MAG: alpha-2-macroglobulin family protein, partial [Aggregatilineales bacterium]